MPIRAFRLSTSLCALLWLLSCKGRTIDPKPIDPKPIVLGDAAPAYRHLVGPGPVVRLSKTEWRKLYSSLCGPSLEISYELTISASGSVQSAHILPDPVSCERGEVADNTPPSVLAHLAELNGLVYSLRFRPWLVNGHAVSVVTRMGLPYALAERFGSPRLFPASIDASTVTIGLDRRGCEGPCPVYSVLLAADGTVTYTGEANVAVTGTKVKHIPANKVSALLEQFRKANFLSALPRYSAMWDGDDSVLRLTLNGATYRVEDESGLLAGLPSSILALEDAVDETADSASWVGNQDRRYCPGCNN